MHAATYSPEDNKLRLYPESRLPKDEYNRIKAAGFSWAPKQELFVAPMWTPEREDLLIEMSGEIEDEDKSLVDRAEERSERFIDYAHARADDGARAKKSVDSIADNIPFGQPILVGHHSEKRARRDAEKIKNGMRRAIRAFETADYWRQRAAGAVRAAKYKEQPDVRARRIKRIEADARRIERTKAHCVKALALWSRDLNAETALKIAGSSPYGDFVLPRKDTDKPDFDQCPSPYAVLSNSYPTLYGSRTLQEVLDAGRAAYPPRIERCDRWLAHYANRLAYEKAMIDADGGTVADKSGPEVGGGVRCWATRVNGGFSYIQKVNKVSVTVLDNWGNGGGNFTRTIPFDKLVKIASKAEVEAARTSGTLVEFPDKTGFCILGDVPTKSAPQAYTPSPELQAVEQLKEAVKSVQVVSAPNLFPTPPDIADRMAGLANITAGDKVLEPSAGTGNLIRSALNKAQGSLHIIAIESNGKLAEYLQGTWPGIDVRCKDFLACNGGIGRFDRILMNPPFDHGSDIKHIKHAREFLAPGGRLVALCAAGPKQEAELRPMADSWEVLPEGSFKEQGTNVRVALLVITV